MQLIAVFQLVFQRNLKTHISQLNQISKKLIQITPAHQFEAPTKPANCGFCCFWGLESPAG
jgi:hypothetical protein